MIFSLIIFFVFLIALLFYSFNYGRKPGEKIVIPHIFSKDDNLAPKEKQEPLLKIIPLGRKSPLGKSYYDYLDSMIWQEIRHIVLSRDDFTCTICKSTRATSVHHRTYRHVYNELDHMEDLTSLCWKCHSEVDHEPILETWPTETIRDLM